jgi:signal transduction histidine kinase
MRVSYSGDGAAARAAPGGRARPGASSAVPPFVLLAIGEESTAALVRETLAAAFPGASVECVASEAAGAKQEPACDCLIVDGAGDVMRAVERARLARAAGLAGGLVVLLPPEATATAGALVEQLATYGAVTCALDAGFATALPAAVTAACAPRGGGEIASVAERSLRRVQQLQAAGEIALGLQHAMNNPLTALLAEAQLLELESMAEEQQAAVRRMVELCRRVIALVRKLDGVSERKVIA